MNLTPEQLPSNGYILKDKLVHSELVPFIQLYMKKRTLSSIFYIAANIVSLGFIVFVSVISIQSEAVDFGDVISKVGLGFALAFLLLPIHEIIHALAYKLMGAKEVSFDADLKKFIFLAVAHRFVANRKEFQIVAVAPFAVISILLFLSLFFTPSGWSFIILGILFAHTAFCSGDFGLLSYFDFHADNDIVTYDDKENKVSFFYEKVS